MVDSIRGNIYIPEVLDAPSVYLPSYVAHQMVAQTQDILLDCVLGLHIYVHISLATPSSHALLDEDSRLPESCNATAVGH